MSMAQVSFTLLRGSFILSLRGLPHLILGSWDTVISLFSIYLSQKVFWERQDYKILRELISISSGLSWDRNSHIAVSKWTRHSPQSFPTHLHTQTSMHTYRTHGHTHTITDRRNLNDFHSWGHVVSARAQSRVSRARRWLRGCGHVTRFSKDYVRTTVEDICA